MKKTVVGILAHVDAGKTTLSEALLFQSGKIRKLGRVDHQDTFLDQERLERQRGITIFSKQAILSVPDPLSNSTELQEIMLLDTPGHVDFSSEMERTLQVLDYAILVISASDGVQSHTKTLWKLLKRYSVPTFLFVNKMDLSQQEESTLLKNLKTNLSEDLFDFSKGYELQQENLAMTDENILEKYLTTGQISLDDVQILVENRKIFPCYFGSALKLKGTEEFLQSIAALMKDRAYSDTFSAKVYKIVHDAKGERITHIKITGGTLRVKNSLEQITKEGSFSEKVNQIRRYNGSKFETVDELSAGYVCAVTGLTYTYPGMGLGTEKESEKPVLDSFLTYQVIATDGTDIHTLEKYMKSLEEEDPLLHVIWNSRLGELSVQLMGEIQLEVLQKLVKERYGVSIDFGEGHIVYRETILNAVEGVGHYEPLRHYAEVHLLLEPGEQGSGLEIQTQCSEDILDKNFQRLVLTHLGEKVYEGVLTGSPITDIRITLISGAVSVKHTVGGDMREATYRAVRQGLMKAKSQLLEPWYNFELTVPTENVGRALSDLPKLYASFDPPETEENGMSVIRGSAPVVNMKGYPLEVTAYTKGNGNLQCMPKGYLPCHNADEVIEAMGYDPTADPANSPDSVFCSHGAGFVVPWDRVTEYMHQETIYSFMEKKARLHEEEKAKKENEHHLLLATQKNASHVRSGSLEEDKELMEIFEKTYGPIKERNFRETKSSFLVKKKEVKEKKGPDKKEVAPHEQTEYLLVDGYNIVFAWEELSKMAMQSLDMARTFLADLLCGYQSFKNCVLILVFDAYNVERDTEDILKYHNIFIVYTKQAETADTYIERTTYEIDKHHRIRVATSDGAEQAIVMGHGAIRVTAMELHDEVMSVRGQIKDTLRMWNDSEKDRLMQTIKL